jgi:hypothetical protein
MTPARREALRRAQLASGQKRRGKGKKAAKTVGRTVAKHPKTTAAVATGTAAVIGTVTRTKLRNGEAPSDPKSPQN